MSTQAGSLCGDIHVPERDTGAPLWRVAGGKAALRCWPGDEEPNQQKLNLRWQSAKAAGQAQSDDT